MTNETESRILSLITADRLGIPIKSLAGKLDRRKEKFAQAISLPNGKYQGERVYARIEAEDKLKSRTITQAVELFCTEYPTYGGKLQQMIEDQRSVNETHLYFGVNPGCRLSSEDYLGIMKDLGFSEQSARDLYPLLMDASRNIKKARQDGERSILIG